MKGSRRDSRGYPFLGRFCCHVCYDRLAHFKKNGLVMHREGC